MAWAGSVSSRVARSSQTSRRSVWSRCRTLPRRPRPSWPVVDWGLIETAAGKLGVSASRWRKALGLKGPSSVTTAYGPFECLAEERRIVGGVERVLGHGAIASAPGNILAGPSWTRWRHTCVACRACISRHGHPSPSSATRRPPALASMGALS